ncbi:hypothetical protein BEWA_007150 [Theileria equi strain WA]|uniref:RAP domain-containing protein n=1 Tax=Theileria equi strain WA TaxID=1537102 RepID=L0B233_THEEQ|nr:hypothetical protein BEWA_007150 [Theileria equi strain WA]AFZ81306.1 hypothetical protein BEWA_007150 [Theileria equi strain WA]|eukprot:XP_004830972.1 hypothetical protein BEWA_007150 [Theileria equi strain WA]
MIFKNANHRVYRGFSLWLLFLQLIIAENGQSSRISINTQIIGRYTHEYHTNCSILPPLTWISNSVEGPHYRKYTKSFRNPSKNHGRYSQRIASESGKSEVEATKEPDDDKVIVADIINKIVKDKNGALSNTIISPNFDDRFKDNAGMSYQRPSRKGPGLIKEKLTMADLFNRKIVAQPPSRRETEQLMSRKPWKHLEISQLIKKEKEKIKNDTTFLDGYFYKYLEDKGENKFNGVFKKNINDNKKYKFDIQELLSIWANKVAYFYMNIPKTVATLEIVKDMTESSNITPEIFKSVKDHIFYFRILKSLLKHISYVNKIRVSNHLSSDTNVLKHIPAFTPKQIVSIFSSLAFFQSKSYVLLDSLLNYVKKNISAYNCKQLTSIIGYCMKLDYKSDIILKEYISKVRHMLKNSKDTQAFNKEDILSVLSVCAKSDYMDNDLFKALAHIVQNSDNLTLAEASDFIRHFSLVQYIDEKFFDKLYGIICSGKNSLKMGIDIFNFVYSIMECHVPPPAELMDYIITRVLKNASEYNLLQLTTLLKCFSILGYYNDRLFRKVFELPIFINPPKPQVMEQIRLGLNSNSGHYSAYLLPNKTCQIDIFFANVHSAYLGYSLEYKKGTFKFSDEALENIKKIPARFHRFSNINSSGLHLDISALLKEFFSINCVMEHVTEYGLIVDLAILPESLNIPENEKEFIRTKKCSIEVHGPFHYLQKSTDVFPPPMNNKTLYKQRLLKSSGWDTKYLNYWDYVPWMRKEHKLKVLTKLLPSWVKNACGITPQDTV